MTPPFGLGDPDDYNTYGSLEFQVRHSFWNRDSLHLAIMRIYINVEYQPKTNLAQPTNLKDQSGVQLELDGIFPAVLHHHRGEIHPPWKETAIGFAAAAKLANVCEGQLLRVLGANRVMAVFDKALFHKGYFGYEDGNIKYMGGDKLIIEEQDNDFWSVFEAEEQLRSLGNRVENISTLWYKDPEVEELEVGMTQFVNDRDVVNMVNLGLARGCIELYVVYEGYDQEGFPKIG
ncbi:hypothetical protein PIB30_024277 [Stylosanthes scabra]|uniref:PB1-like domain-containing protein n=1 Tax=Stylosanthes scabra TaxID=79078 RepID=A0ABU6V8V3_9FABA|nr:hypothetical protein [Stylosanthes scabra]